MYMFVHIRKVFPKNVFITHHFFLESCICDYKNLEICWFSLETGVPAAVVTVTEASHNLWPQGSVMLCTA